MPRRRNRTCSAPALPLPRTPERAARTASCGASGDRCRGSRRARLQRLSCVHWAGSGGRLQIAERTRRATMPVQRPTCDARVARGHTASALRRIVMPVDSPKPRGACRRSPQPADSRQSVAGSRHPAGNRQQATVDDDGCGRDRGARTPARADVRAQAPACGAATTRRRDDAMAGVRPSPSWTDQASGASSAFSPSAAGAAGASGAVTTPQAMRAPALPAGCEV